MFWFNCIRLCSMIIASNRECSIYLRILSDVVPSELSAFENQCFQQMTARLLKDNHPHLLLSSEASEYGTGLSESSAAQRPSHPCNNH